MANSTEMVGNTNCNPLLKTRGKRDLQEFRSALLDRRWNEPSLLLGLTQKRKKKISSARRNYYFVAEWQWK